MLKRDKRSFTEEEQHQCWQLWRQGLGFSDIARELESKPGTIFGVIRLGGGYSPPQHTRNKQHLTLLEREEISRGVAQGNSIRNIAAKLNRSPSTVSRELSRHGGVTSYRATHADQMAWQNASRPKACKLASSAVLCDFITRSFNINGHHNRFLVGYLAIGLIINSCRFLTKPSIKACIFKPVVCLKKSSCSSFDTGTKCVILNCTQPVEIEGRSVL